MVILMNAGFFKRLLAFVIDFMIVNLIVSIVTIGMSTTKVENLNKQLVELENNMMSGEVSIEEFTEKSTSIMYDLEKASIPTDIVTVIIFIGYFIVFQYLNKGQTLGKKIFKIKIVEGEKKDSPRLTTVITRSLLIDMIFMRVFIVAMVIALDSYAFVMVYGLFSMLYMIFIFICVFMMLFRNDKVSLHDMITRSNVVEV